MIRKADMRDIPRLIEMGLRFIRETGYSKHVEENPEQMRKTLDVLIPKGLVLVADENGVVGMIGFLAYEHPLSGEKVASELFWWVDPEHRGHGKELMRAAEEAARHAGARKMQMIAPTEGVEVLYRRMGYTRLEAAYQRSL